ncbi:hypothetical protein [Desulfomicrobium baculatum]|uniref:Lipoprotein n=1 Tax=Desulfomicrobium baculatum (strain DSM 4028 / VKM B-1378 / X) TaxID=525897 RepID=C7LPZ9_DESBD|nr:hypothetical protein [Desulfomicrobium baculatum]ACU91481.1 hypothetical protein Dbac_3409 [Desulfomicrobium baculatum DSM 4028]
MNTLLNHRTFIFTALSAVLILLSACAPTPFSDRYQPGADTVFLWRNEPIPLEPGWRYVDEVSTHVRGELQDSFLTPVDEIRSLIFVREEQEHPAILILSRVVKTSQVDIFRYLGGTKTIIGGYPYRENAYGLSANSTDPEYGQYFEKIRASGLVPAPEYKVRILDRLPVDTTLIRIMELTPGKSHLTLPAYGKLYPQERPDSIRHRTF